MAKNKTTESPISVDGFINAVKDETKRKDSFNLIQLIKKQTGLEPKMWVRVLLVLVVIITNMTADMKETAHL